MADNEHEGCVAWPVIPWLSGLVSLGEIEMLGRGEFRSWEVKEKQRKGRGVHVTASVTEGAADLLLTRPLNNPP